MWPRRTSAIAALAAALALPTLAAAAAPNLVSVLASPIASAKQHHVQVLLPSTINAHGVKHLYGAGGATPPGYDIQLSSAPGCDDSDVCFVAEFTASQGDPGGTAVSLAHGIKGHYLVGKCGASCNPAVISWREYGRTYGIAYIGSRQQIVSLADAAISAGPR
jgi:hypothetical protein